MKKTSQDKFFTKSVIFAIVMVVVLIVVTPLQVMAWFARNNNSSTSNIGTSVVDESSVGEYAVTVTILQSTQTVGVGATNLLYPDSYALAKLTLRNDNNYAINRQVVLSNASVIYPTGDGFAFPKEYIYTEDYVDANGDFFDETAALPNYQTFFLSFLSPVTNAVCYEIYTQERSSFHEGYTPKYLTSAPNSTAQEQASAEYVTVAENNNLFGSNVLLDGTTSSSVTADGRFVISANSSLDVYLLVYFDPEFYPTFEYVTGTVTMQNSNAYMKQSARLDLSFSDEPA